MTLSVYEVTLLGAEPKGRFTQAFTVMADGERTAETLARASAALRDFAVINVHIASRPDALVEDDEVFPRVISHGQRDYVDTPGEA